MKNQFIKIIRRHVWEITLICAVLGLMIAASFYFNNRLINRQVGLLGEETMDSATAAVTASLKQVELQFEVIFEQLQELIHADADQDSLHSFLYDVRDEYLASDSRMPEFMSAYGLFDNEFLDDSDWVPDADYDPVKRPWYIAAIQNKDTINFSEPYIDAQTGQICITFSRRLTDHADNFYGVFAIDLEISRITDLITDSRIDNVGYGVLISDNLHIIYHRDKDLYNKDLREVGYGHLTDLIESGEAISMERITDLDGKASIVFFRTIFSGWHVGLIVPSDGFFQQTYQMVAVLSVLGFLLLGLLAYIFVKIMFEKIRSDEENAQKSFYVERISHELRTPINAIIAMSDIAKHSDEQKRIYCLNKIHDASHYLSDIITNALDMSKIEAGDIELHWTDFCITELMNRVTAILGYDIAQKNQELNIHIGTHVPEAIIADLQILTQVLTNLLSNAHKNTPSGGRINMSVEVVSRKEEEIELRFSVADNSITKLTPEKITEILGVGVQNGSASYGGSGLDLVISQNLIAKLGGEIWVESEPGEGIRFIFDISIRAGKAVPEVSDVICTKAKPELITTKFPGKWILLVEDMEINREIVMELLYDTEVMIDCAENGREGVAMFSEDPDKYDLIFMDIQMPEMDGYVATAKIREMDAVQARHIPIVAMTANVFKEDAEHCIKAGMNGHIAKPIDKEEVLLAMQEFFVMK